MKKKISGRPTSTFVAVTAALLLAVPIGVSAQRGGPPAPLGPASERAAIDMTGYWVSVVTEDWKFRMVTPPAGQYRGVPLNREGQLVADTWDPARDEAAGEECRAYGAPGIMRVPGRLNITWENDDTLRIDTDAGTQTRLFRFDDSRPADSEPGWQGHSVAEWQYVGGGRGAARAGSLKVVTTGMRPGYVRKNGVPYSETAVLTEYYDLHSAPNGDEWLVVTTILDDLLYFNGPFLTSTNFKRLPDATGWNPTTCSAR